MPAFIVKYLPESFVYMLMSALGFALMAVCVKEASLEGIPVFEIVAARAFVSLVLSYLDVRRKKINIWGNNKPLLFARGAVGTVAMIGTYYAITTLPMAEATLLQYLHPVFTALLAIAFLKEPARPATMICLFLCMLGLGFMVQPGVDTPMTNTFPPLSLAAGLLGAVGSAVAYVLVRRLSQTEDSSVIIFYFPLVSLPLTILLAVDQFVIPSLWVGFVLVMVGVFTQMGQIGLTKAMRCDEASIVSAYSYVQVIFAAVLGFVFFDEIPPVATVFGGALIIVGALVNLLGKNLGKRQRTT